jgi:hypothetical protein
MSYQIRLTVLHWCAVLLRIPCKVNGVPYGAAVTAQHQCGAQNGPLARITN